jgi:hypothetical protein
MALPEWLRNFTTETDGTWAPGGTYSFEFNDFADTESNGRGLYETSDGNLTGDWLFLVDRDNPVSITGSTFDNISLEQPVNPPPDTIVWWRLTFTIPTDIAPGTYTLLYASYVLEGETIIWTVTDSYDIMVGIPSPSYFIPDSLVPDRPLDYDPDLGWDEENSVWTPTARGGGRYRQQFIAIGEEGEIYYGGV